MRIIFVIYILLLDLCPAFSQRIYRLPTYYLDIESCTEHYVELPENIANYSFQILPNGDIATSRYLYDSKEGVIKELDRPSDLCTNCALYYDGGNYVYILGVFTKLFSSYRLNLNTLKYEKLPPSDFVEKTQLNSSSMSFTGDGLSFVGNDSIVYSLDFYNKNIVGFHLNDPSKYFVYKKIPRPDDYNKPHLTALYGTMPVACDSLMWMGKYIVGGGEYFIKGIKVDALIDPNTLEYRFWDCDLLKVDIDTTLITFKKNNTSFSDASHQKAPVCKLEVDLDADDSNTDLQVGGISIKSCMTKQSIPISDDDISIITNGGRLRSVSFQLSEAPDEGETIEFRDSSGFVIFTAGQQTWQAYPNDKFDMDALSHLLKNVMYIHNGTLTSFGRRTVSVEINLTTGQSYSVFTFIDIQSKSNQAGPDVLTKACVDADNPIVPLGAYLSPEAASGGTFIYEGNALDNSHFPVSSESLYSFLYTVGDQYCADTSLLVLNMGYMPKMNPQSIENRPFTPGLTLNAASSPSDVTLSWHPKTALSCYVCESPTLLYPVSIDYRVTATAPNGCFFVAELPVSFKSPYFPTVLYRNGSLDHSFFFLSASSSRTYDLEIFDLTGKLIFKGSQLSTGNLSEAWQCLAASQGLYLFRLHFIDDNQPVTLSGKFLIF